MTLRDVAVRWVPRHTRLGATAWSLGRRMFGPKVLVPGTLGDVLLIVPPERLSAGGLFAEGLPRSTRIDHAWPVKPRDVHRSHGYHLVVIEIGQDPGRYLNAYRAAFVESSLLLLDTADVTAILWRLRSLGDPLGYHASHLARATQDLLDPALDEQTRFAFASVTHLARVAKCIVVRDPEEVTRLAELGSLTPTRLVEPGPGALAAIEAAVADMLAMVKDPAHAALELWAEALADMGLRDPGSEDGPGLAYLRAMETFRGTPSNLHERA